MVFGKPVGFGVEGPFEEGLNFEGVVSLSQLQNHSLIFLVAHNQQNQVLVDKDIFDFRKLFAVGNVNVLCIVNIHSVLVRTFLSVVLPLLKIYYDQVVLSELPDQSFLALQVMSSDLFALIKLNDILPIILESHKDVSRPFSLHNLDLVLQNSSFLN